MSRGRIVVRLVLFATLSSSCLAAPRDATIPPADIEFPDDRAFISPGPTEPLRCTERATIPTVEHVTNIKWSQDARALALTRIVIVPSRVTVTGYREQQVLTILDVASGTLRDVGEANRPEWSGSGAYLSYWKGDGYLHVNLAGTEAGVIEASTPETRWDGDTLYFWYADEIRAWDAGVSWTVAHVDPALAIRYPRDDPYFSADAQRFLISRYAPDGSVERFVGLTATGETVRLDDADITFAQWAPRGHRLLVRSNDRVTLRDDGAPSSTLLAKFTGTVHGWTADGRVLLGAVSPTVPGGDAFDQMRVWDPGGANQDVATLPNLLGSRVFSPDGRYFAGVSRTGLYATQLELYRCGVSRNVALRADPAARARQARIDADGRRFVRPVAGAVSQFLQGSHTGIDIAAPFGSLIVAADDGIVTTVGWVPVGGRRVCVQHARDLESCYYHTSAALVSIGQRVSRGAPIALIGMTGLTTGPHVHWEVKQSERIVDPLGL